MDRPARWHAPGLHAELAAAELGGRTAPLRVGAVRGLATLWGGGTPGRLLVRLL